MRCCCHSSLIKRYYSFHCSQPKQWNFSQYSLALLLKSLSTVDILRFFSHENELIHCFLGFTRTASAETKIDFKKDTPGKKKIFNWLTSQTSSSGAFTISIKLGLVKKIFKNYCSYKVSAKLKHFTCNR